MTSAYSVRRGRSRGGFTLIELLVVLGIIAILITLSITVGSQVTRGGEERLARDITRVLDVTLTSWYGDKDSKFPAYLEVDGVNAQGRDNRVAIVDGYGGADTNATNVEPTLAMYLLVASESASVDSTLKQQIDAKYLGTSELTTTYNESFRYQGQEGPARTVLDPWGQPIRFVHPVWHGGFGTFVKGDGTTANRPTRKVPRLDGSGEVDYVRTYRRPGIANGVAGTADEGICPGNRPYFYSAGRDKDPGTREDNVYGNPPSFPPETAKLK